MYQLRQFSFRLLWTPSSPRHVQRTTTTHKTADTSTYSRRASVTSSLSSLNCFDYSTKWRTSWTNRWTTSSAPRRAPADVAGAERGVLAAAPEVAHAAEAEGQCGEAAEELAAAPPTLEFVALSLCTLSVYSNPASCRVPRLLSGFHWSTRVRGGRKPGPCGALVVKCHPKTCYVTRST